MAKYITNGNIRNYPQPVGVIKDIKYGVSRSFVFMRDAPCHKILFELPCCIRSRPFVAGVILCLCLMIYLYRYHLVISRYMLFLCYVMVSNNTFLYLIAGNISLFTRFILPLHHIILNYNAYEIKILSVCAFSVPYY